jgi:glycosyltransferase involved in cell wall biosynthesis
MKTGVFTIASNNYAAYVRTLCQSLREHEPEWDRYALIVDRPLAQPVIPADEARVLHAADLPLPLKNWFFFQYNIMEGNTAVKPWMFDWLFDRGYDAVVYLDPDIKVYSPLKQVHSKLQEHDILLTPHLTQPYADVYYPGETHIRRAGIHNLGFAAMREAPVTRQALTWWQKKLTHKCVVALDDGIFVDQSWMDFAPSFYGAGLLNDPGYNIAYWNLHERPLKIGNFPKSAPTCKGRPVSFLHFSGFTYRNPLALSIHQNRFNADNVPADLIPLLHDYAHSLRENGIEDTEKIPYGLDSLDGLRLPDILRMELRKLAWVKAMIGNNVPTRDMSKQLLDYLCSPDPRVPCLPIFLARFYAARPDVQKVFVGCDHGLSIPWFVRWFEEDGRQQANFDPAFPSSGWWNRENLWQEWVRLAAEKFVQLIWSSGWSQAQAFLRTLSPLYQSLHAPRLSKFKARRLDGREKLRINLYGYFLASSGMGEVARSLHRAFEHFGIEHRLINLDHGGNPAKIDLPFSFPNFQADVDLMVANVDSFEGILDQFPEPPGPRKYRVGYWLWEMETPPQGFSRVNRMVDEIWCASEQNAATFRRHTRRPVRVTGLNLSNDWKLPRPFPFPDISATEKCVFVTMCDCLSYPERKNPILALQAYLQAFPRATQDSVMVVKLSNGHCRPDTIKQLMELADDRQDVFVRNVALSSHEVIGLVQNCNVLISLHAQEGFGLPIAEAISLGKEVVVTAHGGNMDFCNQTNAHLVPFQLYRLEEDLGPYLKGNVWAKPDVFAAANFLREIYAGWKQGEIGRQPTTEISESCYRKVAENLEALKRILHQ